MRLMNLFRSKNKPQHKIVDSTPFVISLTGEIYSDLSGQASDIQLASGGKKILGAGRWVVIDGKLLALTNESPEFHPSYDQMKTVVEYLAKSGMDLSGDGNGVLVLVYSDIDEKGRGLNVKTYRARVSSDSIEFIPE